MNAQRLLRDGAIRLGLDSQLRRARALVVPEARREFRDSEHLRLLLAFTLSEDSNCIDVGCHDGEVLKHIVQLAPRGQHIAYEPLDDFHARLCEAFPEVDVRRAALSNASGQKTFVHARDDPARSGFRERTYRREGETAVMTVRVETLDAALPSGYVPSLIKIDVEGAEQEVLEGAIETIASHKPVVVFEHGKGAAPSYGTGPAQVFGLLCGRAGLRIFDLDGNGPYSLERFEETFGRGDRWNFVAHP